MNKPFIEIDAENFTLSSFETKPIEGYQIPFNKETGEQFPNCCPYHKYVYEDSKKWFDKFPYCCEPHKKFIGKWWFEKDKYNGIAEKIVRQLSFTEHQISERAKQSDWYKDITDYIEYNILSFGHPAVGLHLYLNNVMHVVKNSKNGLTIEQRERLSEYIEGNYKFVETPKSDLNLLYSTYQKWLNTFPFELSSYFGKLKDHFEKQFPLLNGKAEVNRYSGIATGKIHTKSSLIEVLTNLTDDLLTQINSVTLYEKGLITDANKIKLELIISERKLKLKQGYKYNSPDDETRYKKMIQYWFEDEKKFIDEITPCLKGVPPPQAESKDISEIQNNFDAVKIIDVYNHFKAGLVDKRHLTEQELKEYLKVAFEKMVIPETLFKIKDAPTKQKVIKVFYEYYKNVAGKPHGKQIKYAALLGNYFEGFDTDNVSTNFNK